jgi:high affinity Mn2+ porin
MGILIGDGRLNYQQEKVLEAYYTVSLIKYMTFTFDY